LKTVADFVEAGSLVDERVDAGHPLLGKPPAMEITTGQEGVN